MNKKDYRVVYCDWKEDVPIKDILKYGKKYKHFYQLLADDGNYIIFSDFKIRSDEAADKLIWLEVE